MHIKKHIFSISILIHVHIFISVYSSIVHKINNVHDAHSEVF